MDTATLVLVLLVIVVLFFAVAYNNIIKKEQRVKQAWADIDVQLQRAAELLPNLVNTLKGSAKFERSTLQAISEAYSRYVAALKQGGMDEQVREGARFFNVIYPIILQLPQYPELQTVQAFRDVLSDLRNTMDKIAYARQFYNQAVQDYNTYILSFPWNIVAKLFGKKEYTFFNIEASERRSIEDKLRSGDFTKGLDL